MEAGWAWLQAVSLVAVYADLGTSKGMLEGILRAQKRHVPTEYRYILMDNSKKLGYTHTGKSLEDLTYKSIQRVATDSLFSNLTSSLFH